MFPSCNYVLTFWYTCWTQICNERQSYKILYICHAQYSFRCSLISIIRRQFLIVGIETRWVNSPVSRTLPVNLDCLVDWIIFFSFQKQFWKVGIETRWANTPVTQRVKTSGVQLQSSNRLIDTLSAVYWVSYVLGLLIFTTECPDMLSVSAQLKEAKDQSEASVLAFTQ